MSSCNFISAFLDGTGAVQRISTNMQRRFRGEATLVIAHSFWSRADQRSKMVKFQPCLRFSRSSYLLLVCWIYFENTMYNRNNLPELLIRISLAAFYFSKKSQNVFLVSFWKIFTGWLINFFPSEKSDGFFVPRVAEKLMGSWDN